MRRIFVKTLEGVEERTIGRRSLGREGVVILGMKVRCEVSQVGGTSET